MGKKRDNIGIKQREKDIQEIIRYAAKNGIESIYKNHPIFHGAEKLLLNHVDWEKLHDKAEEVYSNLLKNNIYGERANKYIKREIEDYVSSGKFFDEKGNKIIVEKSFKENPNLLEKIVSFFKPQSEGEKELTNTMGALHDLYTLYKSGGYEQSIPQLKGSFEKAGEYITKAGGVSILPAAANVLDAYGVKKEISNSLRREYNKEHRKIIKKGKGHLEEVTLGLKKYASKIAASVLGVIGISLIIFSSKITGAVIDVQNSTISKVVGACMIFGSLLLIFNLLKKKIKK